MNKRINNTGLSSINLLCYLFTIGMLVLGATKILPSYYDAKFLVVKGLESLRDDPSLNEMGRSQLKAKLGRYFDLNGVRGEPAKGIKVIRHEEGYLVNVDYKVKRNLFANVDAVIHHRYQLNTVSKECCEYLIEEIKE